MKEPHELCEERLRSLGFKSFRIFPKLGPFAAAVLEVEISGPAVSPARLVYKQPAAGRWNEYPLFERLGDFLSGWAPAVVAQFPDEPRAVITEYAGEPVWDAFQSASRSQQQRWLGLIVKRLAVLHAASAPHAVNWLRAGTVESYPFSNEWAEWAMNQLSRLRDTSFPYDTEGLLEELRQISECFYPVYAQSLRCQPVLTHGDPHMGNIVGDESRFVFIDWEWCNAATPVRDIAVLLQDVQEEALAETALNEYIEELLLGGYVASREDVIHDFDFVLVDNTIMMMAWDIELFMSGRKNDIQLLRTLELKRQRLRSAWKRIVRQRLTREI